MIRHSDVSVPERQYLAKGGLVRLQGENRRRLRLVALAGMLSGSEMPVFGIGRLISTVNVAGGAVRLEVETNVCVGVPACLPSPKATSLGVKWSGLDVMNATSAKS